MSIDEQTPHLDKQEKQGQPAPLLVILLVIPLVGILIALLIVAAQLGHQAAEVSTVGSVGAAQTLLNEPAPDFQLPDLDGHLIRLEDYRGRTLFLNFWQTTCIPCITEMPEIMEFIEEQGEDGAAVLTINFDETTQKVREFFAQYDIFGVPVAMDAEADVKRAYGVQGLPTTFVISPQGNIRFIRFGPMTFNDMQDYRQLVETTDPST